MRFTPFAFAIFLILSLGVSSQSQGQESFVAVEAHSGKITMDFNGQARRPIGSLTNVATAMVVLDWSRLSGTAMSQMAVVPNEAVGLAGPNPMSLQPGDQISLREAMYSMLLGSDAVAAATLASHAGRSIAAHTGSTPVRAFLTEMNNLAAALGMKQTRFTTPFGGPRDFSSARDMARLTIYACRNQGFLFYVKQKSRKVQSFRGGQRRGFTVGNSNTLLGGSIKGVKSAQSAQAGSCLILNAEKSPLVAKNPDGSSTLTLRRMITVVLNSPNRETRSQSLIQQGWNVYDAWLSRGRPVAGAADLLVVPQP